MLRIKIYMALKSNAPKIASAFCLRLVHHWHGNFQVSFRNFVISFNFSETDSYLI